MAASFIADNAMPISDDRFQEICGMQMLDKNTAVVLVSRGGGQTSSSSDVLAAYPIFIGDDGKVSSIGTPLTILNNTYYRIPAETSTGVKPVIKKLSDNKVVVLFPIIVSSSYTTERYSLNVTVLALENGSLINGGRRIVNAISSMRDSSRTFPWSGLGLCVVNPTTVCVTYVNNESTMRGRVYIVNDDNSMAPGVDTRIISGLNFNQTYKTESKTVRISDTEIRLYTSYYGGTRTCDEYKITIDGTDIAAQYLGTLDMYGPPNQEDLGWVQHGKFQTLQSFSTSNTTPAPFKTAVIDKTGNVVGYYTMDDYGINARRQYRSTATYKNGDRLTVYSPEAYKYYGVIQSIDNNGVLSYSGPIEIETSQQVAVNADTVYIGRTSDDMFLFCASHYIFSLSAKRAKPTSDCPYMVKVDGHWVKGDNIYVKVNGKWEDN